MPTYDYECELCGHTFEEFQSITAKSLKKCPKCGKPKLHRLIGIGAGIIFKGSGFYQTDYRSDGYKKSAKADTQPASTAKSGEGASTATASEAPAKKPAKAETQTPAKKAG